jgi:hypothetical protein
MLATPVLAASPNKTPVTGTNLKTLGSQYDPLTYRWVTDGNISHIVYMKLWGTLQINVDGEVIPVNWVDILSGTYNIKTKEGVWKWFEVWTLPNGDTFEGTAHVKMAGGTLITYTEFYSHIVLHGTGVYEGQVLSLSMERPTRATPSIYEGYWLKY